MGLAHITGGGLLENPPRAFNDQLSAHIDASSWPLPPVYKWLMKTNLIAPEELAHTFNCGIGNDCYYRSRFCAKCCPRTNSSR